MVFSSPTFLFVFLPAVLLATWAVPSWARRFLLLAVSIVFYAWGVQAFVFVVIASTLLDWALALGIDRARQTDRRRRALALLVIGILQNLALLGWFKYAGFASAQLEWFAQQLGMEGPGTLQILLPIGISFFTFEKVSYLVDVHRGDVEPRRDPIDALLFVFLFPRAIAGPIVRLREIQNDLRRPQIRAEQVQQGAIRFGHGLLKKVLIADQISPIADAAFASAPNGDLTTAAAWLGVIAYTLQLYFDFSGYSDMAIGIGQMIGFRLPENFRRPYSAVSITDVWRRWHMTLTRWFRDYVYIPLGGSRGGELKTYRNLLIIFVLTGLWHGAAWTYVVFGLYQGTWLLLERRFGWRGIDGDEVRWVALRRAITMLIWIFGLVIFRSDGLPEAWTFFEAMVVPTGGLTADVDLVATSQALAVLALASLIFLLPGRRAGGVWLAEAAGRMPATVRAVALGVGLPLALGFALAGNSSPFLYFQF